MKSSAPIILLAVGALALLAFSHKPGTTTTTTSNLQLKPRDLPQDRTGGCKWNAAGDGIVSCTSGNAGCNGTWNSNAPQGCNGPNGGPLLPKGTVIPMNRANRAVFNQPQS